MSNAKLHVIIANISERYGFSSEFDDVLEKWIVKHEEANCCFYWSSTESVDDFFTQLKEYFKEVGYESARWCQ